MYHRDKCLKEELNMRLRNIKNAKEIVESHPIVINKLNKDTFDNENPIHLEIGMGKGDFIIEMAKLYPDINFIGMENLNRF